MFWGGFGVEYGGWIVGVIDFGMVVIGDLGWSGGVGSNFYFGFVYGCFIGLKK